MTDEYHVQIGDEDDPMLFLLLSVLRTSLGIKGEPRVELGRLTVTQRVQEQAQHLRQLVSIARHQVGDWGVLDEADAAKNEAALVAGNRLMSVYAIDEQKPHTAQDNALWIITEDTDMGRATTLLTPDDY